MGDDWSRWLADPLESGESASDSDTGKAPVVRLRGTPAQEEFPTTRPMLVVGGCGGAGTTTTVLGLAGELALSGTQTVAVDATAAGGDLALRGADEHLHPISLQSWLYGRGTDEPAPLKECLSQATSGFGLLWRDAAPLRRRASYLTVARGVRDAGYLGVFDGGHPIAGRQLLPLLADAEIALVLAIPSRPDAANRLRVTLEWLDDEFGSDGGVVGDTTIVISHQQPDGDSRIADHLRDHLSGWVHGITEIPYDAHLARGELVRHMSLAEPTRAAYGHLLAEVAS